MRLIAYVALLLSALVGAGCVQTKGGAKAPMPSASLMNEARDVSVNRAKPGEACDPKRETCWPRANVAPYGNGDVNTALRKLLHPGVIPDQVKRERAIAALRDRIASGPTYIDVIPRNFRSTNMVFAGGQVLPNVVAVTDAWQPGQSRQADWYEYRDPDGTLFVLFRPHVCSNWSLRIVTPQGLCIYDEILCEGECLTVRMQVMGLI
jgi:hypothetical protein